MGKKSFYICIVQLNAIPFFYSKEKQYLCTVSISYQKRSRTANYVRWIKRWTLKILMQRELEIMFESRTHRI